MINSFDSIAQTLQDESCLILTPNRPLRASIDAWALSSGWSFKGRPSTHFIDDWINERWRQLVASGDRRILRWRILGAGEERALWERIIVADQTALLRPGEMAALASTAHRLLLEWCTEEEEEKIARLFISEEEVAFRRWRQSFEKECAEHDWLARAAMSRELSKACERGTLPRAQHMALVNFSELAPTRRILLERATENLSQFELPLNEDASRELRRFRDMEAELRAAACWAKQLFIEDPSAKIALAMPNLDKHRELIERLLREVLTPGGVLPDSPDDEGDFAIAATGALARTPIVDAALRTLEWLIVGLEPMEFVALLESPFIARLCELSPEHKARLRMLTEDWRGEKLGCAELLGCEREICEDLRSALDSALRHLSGGARTSARWRDAFDACLGELGYPGSRELNSREYRQCLRWRSLLEEFGAGIEIHARLDAREALKNLRQLCEITVFQPEIRSRQLSVMEPAEAASLRFDGLWLAGVEARVWPPLIAPNPLLPIELQRTKKMPGGDPQRDFEFWKRIAAQLPGAARHFVASYSSEDEQATPSLLLADILSVEMPPETLGETDEMQNWRRELIESAHLEMWAESDFPVESANERNGGSRLIADQSACPFRAFARHRLKAGEGPRQRRFGLDASERGALIHEIMRTLWSQLGDSRTLIECKESELKKWIAASVTRELNALRRRHRALGAAPRLNFWKLEAERLGAMILRWLQDEALRAGQESHDYAPLALEEKMTLQLDGLELSLRVDRIDDLGDEGMRIIDYKSGKGRNLKFGNWDGERPRDPQLPIYALALPGKNLNSLGWAVVNEQAMHETREWLVTEKPASKDVTDWESQRRIWRERLESLGREYLRGAIPVKPHHHDACEHCPYCALCRIER